MTEDAKPGDDAPAEARPDGQADLPEPALPPTSAPPSGKTYLKRGRPSRARGQPNSSDAASARWTIRGVPPHVRDMALRAAEGRGMTVGDWVAEAIVSTARAAGRAQSRGNNLPATDKPPDFRDMIERLDERLRRLEEHQQRSFFSRLFGR